ncbi:hypothetical protein, partial [Neptuniibacter sp.]|uniref:hypothetical protein n=1 Tax=Neptuniibacter sp. TaxID=1962643 RepID=UPI00261CAFF6
MTTQTQDLICAFEHLSSQLKHFQDSLLSDKQRYFLLPVNGQEPNLKQANDIITNIWYRDKGDGRCTENLYGLIGVSASTLDTLKSLNESKQAFQACVKEFRSAKEKPAHILQKRAQLLAESLERTGLARLHLKQCYRQIPYLEHTPLKVGFSWYSSGRSIKKLSVAAAEKRLLKLDYSQPHIRLQLQALGKIPSSEVLLQLQPQVPVMRANMVWKEEEILMRKARNCPLPLFFPLDDKQAFPEYNTPSLTPPDTRQRQQRSDLIIDPTPFLPSLRVHRYRN